MSETKLEELYRRVANGIVWLQEHDPTGRFHLWYTARLTPASPMPAQDEASKEEWRTYYSARVQFEKLWAAMEREEKRVAVPGPATTTT